MALNVGINGFGRIGRIIFRTCIENHSIKVTAINDPAVDIEYMCYLIKFDSTHGKLIGTVERSDNEISVDGHKIAVFREKLPTNIPWQRADVQYVIESSGMFTNLEKSSGHLANEGVKRVILTAPSVDVPMLVLGVNEDQIGSGHKVISSTSSTLYCLAPIIKILEDHFGVSEGFVTSIHAMTPSLKPLDGLCLKGKHWRDHRSIHQNIIPATTGACRALGRIVPQVKDKMMGLAFRVPIVNVSVLDISIRLKSITTIENIRRLVEDYGNGYMNNIIKISNEQAVSSDFVGDTHSCILDLDSSLQIAPDFFKLICWYENEYSYACRVIDSILFLEQKYQSEWKSKMAYMRPTPNQSLVNQSHFTYRACSYECHGKPKSLCSTSQDSGFSSPNRRMAKKPVSNRNFGTRPMQYNKLEKKNELFKIWNDEDTVKAPRRHNRSYLFQSCVALKPEFNVNTYNKAQQRLENVKRECSIMASMTDHLLKLSHSSKIEKVLTKEPSKGDPGNTKIKRPTSCNDTIRYNLKVESGSTNQVNEKEKKKDMNCESEFLKNLWNKNNKKIPGIIKDENSLNYVITTNSKGTFSKNNTKNLEEITITISDDNLETKTTKEQSERQCKTFHHLSTDTICDQLENMNIENKTKDMRKKSKPESSYSCPISNQNVCSAKSSKAYDKTVIEDVDTDKKEAKSMDSQDTDIKETENIHLQDTKGVVLQKRLDSILKKLSLDSSVISKKPINTITTVNNRDVKSKPDIYDKLDSVSATDSENSFNMNERKSQVINISDLTNSLEDLAKLDKICRIIEISDEWSDQLLSALNNNECRELKNKKWSFKDLCEKIKLDEFCNKMFSKNNM